VCKLSPSAVVEMAGWGGGREGKGGVCWGGGGVGGGGGEGFGAFWGFGPFLCLVLFFAGLFGWFYE